MGSNQLFRYTLDVCPLSDLKNRTRGLQSVRLGFHYRVGKETVTSTKRSSFPSVLVPNLPNGVQTVTTQGKRSDPCIYQFTTSP